MGSQAQDRNFYIGNATTDGQDTRGWFVGHFCKPKGSLRQSRDLEVKYFKHTTGEERYDWSICQTATTLSLVLVGKFRVIFPQGEYLLGPGDYYITRAKFPHRYRVEEDATVVSVRWPSLPGDHINKVKGKVGESGK